ncbi:MAG: nucleotidyltransferase, partial [Gemmiger sp.]
GFSPAFLREARNGFAAFLRRCLPENPLKCEYYLPSVVSDMLAAGRADVHVLTSPDKWYGITYREDKPGLVAALRRMSEQGLYPTDRLF